MGTRTCCEAPTLADSVEELLEEMGIERPPVDARLIARKLGMEVRLHRDQQTRGRLVHRRQPTIVLRPEPREERHQWIIAHEIGEHLMPRLHWSSDAEDVEPLLDHETRERTANRFAGCPPEN